MTPVCFVFPHLAILPNSPDETHAFALFDGDDSNGTIKDILPPADLEFIRNIESGTPLEIGGIKIKFIKTESGDLKYLNSSLGLAGCSAAQPCPLCKVRRSDFGDFAKDCGPELRTLEEIQGLSHTVAGKFCATCGVIVSEKMVEEAAKLAKGDDAETVKRRKQHYTDHECVLPGVDSLFNIEPK